MFAVIMNELKLYSPEAGNVLQVQGGYVQQKQQACRGLTSAADCKVTAPSLNVLICI
jgi:hypothetical protein